MSRLRRISAYCVLLASCFLVMISIMIAAPSVQAIGLKVSPLKYEQQIELGSENTGYVDVSNPNDSTVIVSTDVEAFRQINIDGDLEFYEDERVNRGIQFDVDQFELAPREAARIFFAVDGNALPEGGVYAALLFSAGGEQPRERKSSAISTTSRVGTLLILQNGDSGVESGEISSTDIPFWQFGDGIEGSVEFAAANREQSIAFEPQLNSSIPLVGEQAMNAGLVFPGNTRHFDLDRTGSYFGVFPVEVVDQVTGDTTRTWVFAATGIWHILAPVILAVFIANAIILQRFRKTPSMKRPHSKRRVRS